MDKEQFEKLFDDTEKQCRKLLIDRAAQYSRNGDRLHNFRRAAEVLRTTPAKALLGMYVKHLTCLLDLTDDTDNDIIIIDAQHHQSEIDEVINDSINYLHLLKAALYEQYKYKPE